MIDIYSKYNFTKSIMETTLTNSREVVDEYYQIEFFSSDGNWENLLNQKFDSVLSASAELANSFSGSITLKTRIVKFIVIKSEVVNN